MSEILGIDQEIKGPPQIDPNSTYVFTGATGTIGSAGIDQLLEGGARVIAPVRDLDKLTKFEDNIRPWVPGARIYGVEVNFTDPTAVEAAASQTLETARRIGGAPLRLILGAGGVDRSREQTVGQLAYTQAVLQGGATVGPAVTRIVAVSSDGVRRAGPDYMHTPEADEFSPLERWLGLPALQKYNASKLLLEAGIPILAASIKPRPAVATVYPAAVVGGFSRDLTWQQRRLIDLFTLATRRRTTKPGPSASAILHAASDRVQSGTTVQLPDRHTPTITPPDERVADPGPSPLTRASILLEVAEFRQRAHKAT